MNCTLPRVESWIRSRFVFFSLFFSFSPFLVRFSLAVVSHCLNLNTSLRVMDICNACICVFWTREKSVSACFGSWHTSDGTSNVIHRKNDDDDDAVDDDSNQRKPLKAQKNKKKNNGNYAKQYFRKMNRRVQRRIYLWTRHRHTHTYPGSMMSQFMHTLFVCVRHSHSFHAAVDGSTATTLSVRCCCQHRTDLIQFISFSGRFSTRFFSSSSFALGSVSTTIYKFKIASSAYDSLELLAPNFCCPRRRRRKK